MVFCEQYSHYEMGIPFPFTGFSTVALILVTPFADLPTIDWVSLPPQSLALRAAMAACAAGPLRLQTYASL